MQHGQHQPSAAKSPDLSLLIEDISKGDSLALSRFIKATEAKARRRASSYLHSRADQDDVLQEVYTSVWLNAPLFDQRRGSANTWFFAIVKNRAIDQIRRVGRYQVEPLESAHDVEEPAPLADIIIARSQYDKIVRNCLSRIPASSSQTIIDVFLRSESHERVAARTAIPLGTVKARVRRGLAALRLLVEQAETGVHQS